MPHPSRDDQRRRFAAIRWRWLVWYWLIQAAAVPFAFLLVAAGVSDGTHPLQPLLDVEYWVLCGLIAVTITLSQAALLAPVGSARIAERSTGWSILRQLGCGFALSAWAAWILAGPVPVAMRYVLGRESTFVSMTVGRAAVFVPVAGVACALALRAWHGSRAPVLATYLMAATMASALAVGLLMLVLEAVEQATGTDMPGYSWVTSSIVVAGLAWGVGWIIVTRFGSRNRPETLVSRVAGVLLAGTVIEAVLAVPIDVMVRRRASCYCGEGTFWTWVLAMTAGFVALGPFVLVLPVCRRRLRRKRRRCLRCGYDRRGMPRDALCPECGVPIRPWIGSRGQ